MSRTNRKYWTDRNWREARKGGPRCRAQSDAFWAAKLPGQYDLTVPWAPRTRPHGGMLMSSSNTGVWSDERHGIEFKRAFKRSERFAAIQAAWAEAADVHDEVEDPFYVDGYQRGVEAFYVDDYYRAYEDEGAFEAGYFAASQDAMLFEDPTDWPW